MRLLRLALPLALAGCTGALPSAQPITLGPSDNGRTVAMRVGDTVTIALDANATTGYRWAVADTAALAPALRLVGEAYTPSPSGGRVGVGGTYTLRLRAEAVGTGTVRLGYARPFEPGMPPERTFTATITVR